MSAEPDVDSDCAVHGVCTWSAHGGHEVVHYCDESCPADCDLSGEETGEWCDGPLEMRSSQTYSAAEPVTAQPINREDHP